MTEEIRLAIQEAQPFLEKLGGLMQQTATFSYEVILRQQYVKVAQTGLGVVLLTLLTIVAYKAWKWALTSENEEALFTVMTGVLFLLIAWIILVVHLSTAVGILINPHYYVIVDIMKLLGGAK